MKITWIGHSCFLFVTENPPLRILIDPYRAGAYDGAIGYRIVNEVVDAVLITHEHPDHSGIEDLPGHPLIIRRSATALGIDFETLELAHDDRGGQLRGLVRAFLFNMEGISITHLSDLGHLPTEAQYRILKGTQVLLAPVGGRYTISASQASEICLEIGPNLVIPMHFKTSKVTMDLESADHFASGQERVKKIPQSTLQIRAQELPEPITTVILTPQN